jgi:hypothetical protein
MDEIDWPGLIRLCACIAFLAWAVWYLLGGVLSCRY